MKQLARNILQGLALAILMASVVAGVYAAAVLLRGWM